MAEVRTVMMPILSLISNLMSEYSVVMMESSSHNLLDKALLTESRRYRME
jgi:hypothetical protein